MDKLIDVFVATDVGAVQAARAKGEAMLDPNEGTLVIHNDNSQTTLTFNWNNVLSYSEQPLKETADV